MSRRPSWPAVASLLAIMATSSPWTASAQPPTVLPQPGAADTVALSVGFEPELVSSLAYAHRFQLHGAVALDLGAGIKLAPLTLAQSGALRAHGIVGVDVRAPSGFGFGLRSYVYYVRDESELGTFNGLGLELRGGPGYADRQWAASLDLGYQLTAATHIAHGQLAHDVYGDRYPGGDDEGPRDGWYGATAQRVRVGLAGAVAITHGLSAQLALGSLFSVQHQGIFLGFNIGQIPIYAELGVAYGW